MNDIWLTPKQAEYIREAHHRWNFAVGAVRSGKSFIALQYVIPNGLVERRGKKGLNFILGASYGNILRNVIDPMIDIWGEKLVQCKRTTGVARIFGEKVHLLGADNVRAANRLRGSEIKFCYVDEICDVNHESFDMLASRLSLEYSICHAACNPSYPTHWIKEFIDRKDKGVDIFYQHYTLWDNPFLPKSYVAGLEAEYAGTVYYKRYILGEWAKAEGLVWPMYTEAYGKYDREKLGPPVDVVVSMDYGTLNPFAAWLWLKGSDKVWYAVRAYYYASKEAGHVKTDDEYGEDLEDFLNDLIDARYQEEKKTGLPQPKIKVIVDPSAASFIAMMKKKPWCKVYLANNDVLNGIRETATAMHRGLIKVNPEIREWTQEVDGYVWDEKREDVVVKQNDHLCVTGDTMVDTYSGPRPIKDMVGTEGSLWCYDGEKPVLRHYHDVVMTEHDAEIYEVELEDGRTLRLTGNHPVLTTDGWIEASKLSEDHILLCMEKRFQFFNGHKFSYSESEGYYISTKVIDGKRPKMHAYVWEYYNGKVPKGYDIHHKDEDKTNNDISNLVVMKRNEHIRLHAKERVQDPEYRQLQIDRLNEMRPASVKWHSTEAGKEWHRQRHDSIIGILHRERVVTCAYCGKEYTTWSYNSKYCSSKCMRSDRLKKGIDKVTRHCVICGRPFSTNKYKNTRSCCSACSHQLIKYGVSHEGSKGKERKKVRKG